VRLAPDAEEVACTSLYLDDAEWNLLTGLPANCLAKTRARWQIDGLSAVVDVFESGLVLAEYDRGDGPDIELVSPEILAEVTHDERFTGAELSRLSDRAIRKAMAEYGV
jgi:CYTH domain-containing protein